MNRSPIKKVNSSMPHHCQTYVLGTGNVQMVYIGCDSSLYTHIQMHAHTPPPSNRTILLIWVNHLNDYFCTYFYPPPSFTVFTLLPCYYKSLAISCILHYRAIATCNKHVLLEMPFSSHMYLYINIYTHMHIVNMCMFCLFYQPYK